jgi:hypothetical protein
MNVQGTGNPQTTRSSKRRVARSHFPTRSSQPAKHIALSADDEQKFLATGVFCLLAGLIIVNSGWSTGPLGYPLMAIGLILAVVPFVATYLAGLQAHRAQLVVARSEAEARKRSGRGVVHVLHSRDYSHAS